MCNLQQEISNEKTCYLSTIDTYTYMHLTVYICMYLQLLSLALLFNEGNVVHVVVYVREHEPRWPQQLSEQVSTNSK